MSNSTNTTLPPDFDPYTQPFELLLPDGTPFQSSMGDIDFFRLFGIRLAINWGTQIGASIILLAVLLLLTKREKRFSLIFIMNALCLLINAIRSILQCIYLVGPFYDFYALLSGSFDRVHRDDQANTIASNVMTLLLVICIMISLTLQVWIVCVTTPKLQRLVIMMVITAVALVAVGYRFAVVVISNARTLQNLGMDDYSWIVTDLNITQAVAIWVYCAVFTYKLGYALVQRRRLGMTQFGPMQIIFIMGCQTMVIPGIFSVLQFYEKVPELGSMALTIVCIFLPLSAIWAGVVADDVNLGASGADSHQRLLHGHFGRTPPASPTTSRNGKASTVGNDTIYSKNEPDSPFTPSPYMEKNSNDLHSHGIQVDREWSVEKGEGSHHY
ncbi:fungal pheromone mating factor STE2 GPCR-domain-containing protein [Lophiotrema nucula]|uniref:Fungal pheromone mating factor STE2 GPCR-domain-containing protein n=1 Tax=Lophiotrema nucula TaxID=690887 RepID=A0A6A5ZSP3_9PLEO|nr:fungal pheromone mating factor STE2 GPCR-domain-containing protein [Lophiotrema nucula]